MARDLFTTVVDLGSFAGTSDDRPVLPLRAPGFGRERYADQDGPFERPLYPTLDEVLYAEQLRLELRERCPETSPTAAPARFVIMDPT